MSLRRSLNLRWSKPIPGCPFYGRGSPRWLSTEAEQPPSSADSSNDSFIPNVSTGLMYGKVFGITRHTFKTDIINMLQGSNLTVDDIKFSYNRGYMPIASMVQFPSHQAYDIANRTLAKKGRLYRLERADRSEWDILMPYDGKTVLLRGVPRNASIDDVERFLSGCEYDPSSIQMPRQGLPVTLVRFPTRTAAMNAFITKNRGFCLNNPITVRVLE
ncbi:hypothetical protein K2173_014482 [Erythroxylum novogranatense]|uniref:Ribosomal protein S24e family protein n=1 Tax=Erythroxylum novogranatense TaxID=1862640 RepID=A0AAV8S4T9_9ROSI|nr:hypothetical protein K2173_014482 [Erythroxylum novogranatense]